MSSEAERIERLTDIVRTAGLLSANVLPIVQRYRELQEDLRHCGVDSPALCRTAIEADLKGLRLRLDHWQRPIQQLWAAVPLALPDLAARLRHIRKPAPWFPDDPSICWITAAVEWGMVEDEARRLLAGGNAEHLSGFLEPKTLNNEPERSPAVDDRDIAILKQLGKLPDRVFVAIEIAAMSDRTAKKRLKGLITQGLVTRPPGKRRGVRISSQGLELLSRLP